LVFVFYTYATMHGQTHIKFTNIVTSPYNQNLIFIKLAYVRLDRVKKVVLRRDCAWRWNPLVMVDVQEIPLTT